MPKPRPQTMHDNSASPTEKSAQPRRMRPAAEPTTPTAPGEKAPKSQTKGMKAQERPAKILHFADHLKDERVASSAPHALSQAPAGEEGDSEPKGVLKALPEPLRALVRAAVSPGLPLLTIPNRGRLADSDQYVLACAAYYAIQCEPEKQVKDLWAIHAVWRASP